MDNPESPGGKVLLDHVLVPVANEDDAFDTARALVQYSPNRITALYVVEKGEGVPDKIPVEQSEMIADQVFETVQEIFPNANTQRAYRRDVTEAIFETAADVDASAIAFRSRGGGRLIQFLSGDIALKLVTQAELPIIVLPQDPVSDD